MRTRTAKPGFLSLVLLALAVPALAVPTRAQVERPALFSLPRSQDDIAELEHAAKDARDQRFPEAVERLQKLLQRGNQGVVPGDSKRDFVGVRLATIQRLRDLSPEGKEAYERLVQREAGALLGVPFAQLKATQLQSLADDFPTSRIGIAARLRLGDLALEQGEGIEAEQHYVAARDALTDDDARLESLRQRRADARALLGSQLATRRGDTAYPARTAVEKEAQERLAPLFAEPPNERVGWPCYGGGAGGLVTMQRPAGKPAQTREWQIPAHGFESLRSAMHATGGVQGIYLSDGHAVWCLDPLSGQIRWRGDGPMYDDTSEAEQYQQGLNSDVVLAAAVGENTVVAALQVPNDIEGASANLHIHHQHPFNVMLKIPSRRLFAFDRWTGKRLWAHWDVKGGALTTRFNGHDVAGPPLVVGDVIYVPCHDQTGAIQYYLSAYDLLTGRPLWRRLICSSQLEVNMFGNAQREFAAAPLALDGGVIYAATNLGVCCAVDASNGRIRWITAYDTIPMPATQLHGQMQRPVMWANSPGVVLEDVFVCTPLDSFSALAFDTRTGKLAWRMSFQAPVDNTNNDVQWLLGAIDDELVFAGAGVVAVQAHPPLRGLEAQGRLVAGPAILGQMRQQPARGALAAGLIWIPTRNGIRVFDREGKFDMLSTELRSLEPGNLMLHDGLLVSVRPTTSELFWDPESLLRDAERRTRQQPDAPFAWLELAIVLRAGVRDLDGGLAERIESTYRKGLAAAQARGYPSTAPLVRRLAEGLFQLTVQRAEMTARTDPGRALAELRKARDEAPDPSLWIAAELQVLRMLDAEKQDVGAELALLAKIHGDTQFTFPDAGRVPAAAYALWRAGASERTPALQAQRCQELLERYPELTIAGERVPDFALRKLQELIDRHGQSIYAPIEQRAQKALSNVQGEATSESLRWIVDTYPHSEAAQTALVGLLDDALRRGDATLAMRLFAQCQRAGRGDARHLRRGIEAARKLDNLPLAARLVRIALASHPETKSDFALDAGKPLREVLVADQAPKALPTRAPELPRVQVAELPAPNGGLGSQNLADVVVVPGFATPVQEHLYVVVGGEKLCCYDLRRGGKTFDAPRWETAFLAPVERPTLWQVGPQLLLVDSLRARALDAETGREQWCVDAPERRTFRCLGVQQGVATLWCEAKDVDDGGQVLSLEPSSGAVLARVVYPQSRPSPAPLLACGEITALDLDGQGMLLLRHDALTGEKLGSPRPGREVQQQLGLVDAALARPRLERLARRMFADDFAIYLPFEGIGAQQHPPCLLACDRQGKLLWSWKGDPDRLLDRAGVVGDSVVIVQTGGDNGGRLIVLDRAEAAGGTPRVRLERALQGRVRVVGWGANGQPPPATLVLTESMGATRLLCVPLDGKAPPFVHDLPRGADAVHEDPVVGNGFLALALRIPRGRSIALVALDLKSRDDLLAEARLRLPAGLTGPFQLAPAGAYIALRSMKAITLLGAESPGNR